MKAGNKIEAGGLAGLARMAQLDAAGTLLKPPDVNIRLRPQINRAIEEWLIHQGLKLPTDFSKMDRASQDLAIGDALK